MKRIEEKPSALDVVLNILDYSFERAISYAEEMGTIPEKIFASISSENLEDDLGLVIHQINKDAVFTLANRLDEIAVSYEKMGRKSLYGAPFIVSLTVVAPKQLKKTLKMKD